MSKAHLDFNNIPAFMDAVFSSSVRGLDGVLGDVESGDHHHSFIDDSSKGRILKTWLAAWQKANGDTYDHAAADACPPWDATLMGFFRDYFKDNDLYLSLPSLDFVKMSDENKWAIYQNNGYSRTAFRSGSSFNYGGFTDSGSVTGNNPVVATFLRHLLFGAHFVFVSTKKDCGSSTPQNLYDTFKNSGLTKNSDSANSHYVNSWSPTSPMWFNSSGWYYQKVTKDETPGNHGLILALLFGQTSDGSDTNTFLQLEGWQNVSGSDRHGQDYEDYKQVLWNYGTFAASVWSERRCTPIFVAPSSFDLTLQSDTHMPHYVGAGSKQNWMATELLQLPG